MRLLLVSLRHEHGAETRSLEAPVHSMPLRSNTHHPVWVEQGYARGVLMGGDLTNSPKGKAPTFMIKALCDPVKQQHGAVHDDDIGAELRGRGE
jgi:hypothetical protein